MYRLSQAGYLAQETLAQILNKRLTNKTKSYLDFGSMKPDKYNLHLYVFRIKFVGDEHVKKLAC